MYLRRRPGEVRPGTTGRTVGSYEIEIKDEDVSFLLPSSSFLTGDRYRQDPDCFHVYEVRVDDMMKIDGLWVSPIEIENLLMEHPAVRETAAVATDIDGRSRIRASVILAGDIEPGKGLVEELQQWCKAALQRYRYPHLGDFVSDIPRTATGRIQRFKLR